MSQHESSNPYASPGEVKVVTTFGGRKICKVCPGCGGKEYKRKKPKRTVAFRSDRRCRACDTVYSVPTPVWAAIVFLLVGGGLAFVAGTFVLGVLALASRFPDHLGISIFISLAIAGVLGLAGLFAFFHGLRALFRPGSV
jgi:hypothetical protein